MKKIMFIVLFLASLDQVSAADLPCEAIVLPDNMTVSSLEECFVRQGLISIQHNGLYGFSDPTGKVVIKPQFDEAWSFQEGLALVKKGNKWGYIRPNGSFAIKPIYDSAWGFSEGLAKVLKNHKVGFINKTGKTVIALKYDDAHAWFTDGYTSVQYAGKWGIINKQGKFVVRPHYREISLPSEGRILFLDSTKDGERYGFLDMAGQVVIAPEYDDATSFAGGIATANKDGDTYYINEHNEPIEPKPSYLDF